MSSTNKGLRRVALAAVSTLVVIPAMAAIASATPTFSFDRQEGPNRYDTAVKVATTFGASTSVILANGTNAHTVDALTAAYLAGAKKAPVLLTQLAATPTKVLDRITASGATTIYIVGDTGVISAAQEAALDAKFGTVTRLGGPDRFDTAAEIIAEVGMTKSTTKTALVATGMVFPDALGAGPLSYVKGMPIGITTSTLVPPATLKALKDAGVTNAIALGGPTVVTPAMVAQLTAAGITPFVGAGVTDGRIFGDNRSETSAKLAQYIVTNQGFSNTGVNVAGGYNAGAGADALGGAPLSGKELRPTLITENVTNVGDAKGPLKFLKDNCATLASGHIFGGPAAVSPSAEALMQAAGRCATSTQTFTVTGSAVGSTFTFADPVTAGNKTATSTSTDVFTVDGVSATQAFFLANLSAGDIVTILPNTPTTGVTTYQLVNKDPADYTSGLVGNVDTGATTFNIIEPITGTVLSGSINYSGANTFYTLNGAASTLAAITLNINEGDTVVITGKNTVAAPRTIALTDTTVTGTASGITASTTVPAFVIDTAAGASLGDVATSGGNTDYTVTGTDVLTVDGVTATASEFNTSLSAGDTVSYARAAGVQTIKLTNKAPLSIHGQITAVNVTGGGQIDAFIYVPDADVSTTVTGLPVGLVLTVDGVLASDADFVAAFTLGDTVVYRAEDAATSTTARLALTNANFSGTVDKGAGTVVATDGTAKVGVFAAGSTTVALGSVHYVVLDNGLTGTPAYTVNGVVKTLTEFNASLTAIKVGSLNGTILVSQIGTKATFALTTAIA